ncbi:hypothetical protein SUGI_0808310 [Cryptomeria japonica]|nr:hypothetical protein SUGI_0808310 [Cryptomeria japonica]
MGNIGLYAKAWAPNFDPYVEQIRSAPVWIRLPKLPMELKTEEVFGLIGNSLRMYLKSSDPHGGGIPAPYARLCVKLDLSKPLKHTTQLCSIRGERLQQIDYECIPLRCFVCGQVGHNHITKNCDRKLNECGKAVKSTGSDLNGKHKENVSSEASKEPGVSTLGETVINVVEQYDTAGSVDPAERPQRWCRVFYLFLGRGRSRQLHALLLVICPQRKTGESGVKDHRLVKLRLQGVMTLRRRMSGPLPQEELGSSVVKVAFRLIWEAATPGAGKGKPTRPRDENEVWSYLRDFRLTHCSDHWLVRGDFNEVLSPEDKRGDCFTAEVVSFGGSDHWLASLTVDKASKPRSCPFKMEAMWYEASDFKQKLTEWWGNDIRGCLRYILFKKLKEVKLQVKSWNKNVFGDLFANKGKVEQEVLWVEKEIADKGLTSELHGKEA